MALMIEDQKTRQRILDYLLANPGAIPSKLGDYLGLPHSTARFHLRMMEDLGEVIRKRVVICKESKRQKRVCHAAYACYAAVTEAKLTERSTSKESQKADNQPGRTTNTRFYDQNAKPYRNQGGQGTVGVMPRGCCVILGE